MKPLRLLGLLVMIGLSFAMPAFAGQLEDGLNAYKRKDYKTALKLLRPLAEQGYGAAQWDIGLMYDLGQGVPQNYAEAIKWWRKSAEQGNDDAQYNLGLMYSNSQGVPQDYVEALKWFRKSADQGDGYAQCNIGSMYEKGQGVPQNYVEAVKWYRKSAEHGHALCQNNLAQMYANGNGVSQDYAEALKWLRKSADYGYANAQYNLGVMYYQGQGVPLDYAEALTWFRKSAEQGEAKAQYNLGVMYNKGEGVPQNYAEAVKWYNLAAARLTNRDERDSAIRNRNIATSKMTPAQIAEAQKKASEWKPIDKINTHDRKDYKSTLPHAMDTERIAPIKAVITIQDTEGTTEADLDIESLKRLENWLVKTSLQGARESYAEQGFDPKTFNPKIDVGSVYVMTGGKKLAVIKMNMENQVRTLWVLGFHRGEFLRVTCIRASNHDIPIIFGECGQKITEAFSVSFNPQIAR